MKINKNFSLHIFARIYAWWLRRTGWKTNIEEWIDDYLSGWFVASGYEVTAWK